MIEFIIIDIIYPLGLSVASNKHEDWTGMGRKGKEKWIT